MALLQMNIMSRALNMSTSVTVILPGIPGYRFSQADIADYYRLGMKYQVLWLLHGGGGDCMDYVRYSSLERYAEENCLMVVTPSAMNSSYCDTPYGQNHWTHLTDELWYMVQECLPASAERDDHFVMGLSMGAHGAFKYGVNFPERFSRVICMSGGGFSLSFLEKAIAENKREFVPVFGNVARIRNTCDDVFAIAKKCLTPTTAPEFYFPVGGEDFIRPIARESAELLQKLGVQAQYEEFPGYGHEWAFWDQMLKEIIERKLPLKRQPIYQEER